jgi:hypothetical protein
MNMPRRSLFRVLGCALLALPFSVGLAAGLVEKQSGKVRYVTGGVGDDEEAAIKQLTRNYSVTMTFAVRQGGHADYLSDVPVAIRDARGSMVLNVQTNGPYLLVKLVPGQYVAEASHDGRLESRRFTVAKGARQSLVFEWS